MIEMTRPNSHARKLAKARAARKPTNIPKVTENHNENNNTFKKVREPHRDQPIEIQDSRLRSGKATEEQNDNFDYNNQQHNMLFGSSNFSHILQTMPCPNCKLKKSLFYVPTSLCGLATHLIIQCSNCSYEKRHVSCDEKVDKQAALSSLALGLTKTQLTKFFLALNFAFYSRCKDNPRKKVPWAANFFAPHFTNIFALISKEVVEKVCPKVQQNALQKAYEQMAEMGTNI